MYSYQQMQNRVDRFTMLVVYLIDIARGACYLYVLNQPGYLSGIGTVGSVLYSTVVGMLIMLNVLIIKDDNIDHRVNSVQRLHLAYCVLQTILMLVDLTVTLHYGRFWQDGYLVFLMKCLLVVIHWRRFLTIWAMKRAAL